MTCSVCTHAHTVPSGEFLFGCRGCRARQLSRRAEFFDAMTTGKLTRAYMAALASFQVEHSDVKAERDLDAMGKP